MGKLLRITDYLLLTAALGADTYSQLRSAFGIYPAALEARYGFVPDSYKKRSYSAIVSRMLSTGDIDRKINSDGRAYLELTSKGTQKFKRKFPLLGLQRKKWDGHFMVVVFDIPEVSRDDRYIVRKKLEALGFAMLQESVWISPYHFEEDLREFFVNNGLAAKVLVLDAKGLYMGNLQDMVKRVWKLSDLDNNYQQIIDRCRKLSELEVDDRKNEINSIMTQYMSLIKSDPLLPEEIDSVKNSRIDAGIAMKKIFNC